MFSGIFWETVGVRDQVRIEVVNPNPDAVTASRRLGLPRAEYRLLTVGWSVLPSLRRLGSNPREGAFQLLASSNPPVHPDWLALRVRHAHSTRDGSRPTAATGIALLQNGTALEHD